MDEYFVIYNSDGDTTVTKMSKETLLERLNEDYWGSRKVLETFPKESPLPVSRNGLGKTGKVSVPFTTEILLVTAA